MISPWMLLSAQLAATPAPASAPPTPGIDESLMDMSINPCDDFYQYACGGWLKKTEIPPDRSVWGQLNVMGLRNEQLLRDLLDGLAAGKPPATKTPYDGKLADFYATCMDEPKLETSLSELNEQLRRIQHIKDPLTLATVVGQLHAEGAQPMFRFGSTQDAKDASQVIGEVDQGGLGLPDRDYYTRTDAKAEGIRKSYLEHVAKVFTLLGEKPAAAKNKAQVVLDLETALAKASLTRTDQRDPQKTYHRINRPGLRKAAPAFPWDGFFKSVGAPGSDALNVTHPPFFTELSRLVQSEPLSSWRTYLTYQWVDAVTEALPKVFRDEHFAFDAKNFSGAKEDKPRWRKCVDMTDEALGEALGQAFVARAFAGDSKQATLDMVKAIEQSFESNLATISWMDEPTKKAALVKLHKFFNKIGYPDHWRNYDAMKTSRGSFLANLTAASQFESERDLAKIGKPLDRSEWLMTPPTVNAYYNPNMNEIVFPAGILQPPVYNHAAAAPVNFGAMGMVVGHETTHGFDDQGRQFDENGNLREWWSPASAKAFEAKTQCVVKAFSDQIAIDDVHINGQLTVGENVADFGGIKLAYAAMQRWMKQHPAPKTRFTDGQAFFLGYAHEWCTHYRPEAARNRAQVDPHSPPFLRVNMPLKHSPAFKDAFGCADGSKMVVPAAQRCEVW